MYFRDIRPMFRRLGEMRPALRPKMGWRDLWPMVRGTGKLWDAAKAQRLGAGLAFYAIISMAPLLVLILAVVGFAARRAGYDFEPTALVGEIQETMGAPVAHAVAEMVRQARDNPGSGWVATIVGAAVLLFGASGVFAELQDALNTIWQVAPKPGKGVIHFIRVRFLSVVLVLGTAFLLLASLVISSIIAALSHLWLPSGGWLLQTVNAVIGFVVITVLFALIFKILPDAHVRWSWVWTGAAGTALLFSLGKHLLALYVEYAAVANGYGAAGAVVVVLVWVYYSSQILLFGTAFTRVYAERFGGGVRPTSDAVALTPQEMAVQGIDPQEVAAAGKA
jgi:membrane protein